MKRQFWENYVDKFNRNDEELTKQSIPNEQAIAWMLDNIPVFECPDKTLEETYYFRWWVFRKHIKQTPEGRIITEFLPPVYWAGPYNSINCAAGHHFAELRWLRNTEVAQEYAKFWFRGSGNVASYSSWIVQAIYEYAKAKNDFSIASDLLSEFDAYYASVEQNNMTQYGLFWSYDDRDAMELSISGSGLRPTLNSYMYANAQAIAAIADECGKEEMAEKYRGKAKDLYRLMHERLWDEKGQFFKVIPQQHRDDIIPSFSFDDIQPERNAREAIGYIPWAFGIPQEHQDIAWKYLNDPSHFAAPFGPTTAERCHSEYRNTRSDHECQWNGPSWPFATTQVLDGMIAALQSNRPTRLNREDFLQVLSGYAMSHYRKVKNGNVINWLDENLDPDTGEWLSRRILEDWGWPDEKGGYERGKDYNHSAFCDLVIRGICGIKLTDSNSLIIDPLVPSDSWTYFSLQDLPYKKRYITILFDSDGTHYGKGTGLLVFIDDKCVASAPNLQALEVLLK